MYVQTCWQCAAKNEVSEEAAGRQVCAECGAELPVAGAPAADEPRPAPSKRRAALARELSGVPVSYLLIAANALFFALMVARGVSPLEPTTESIYAWGADFGPATLGREPWRLLTSVFMHIGVIHLALNMDVLSDVGPLAGWLYGKGGFLALYLLSGVGGSLASIIWNPSVVSAGASGAVFGLFGGLLGLLLTQRDSFNADFAQQHLTRIVGFLAINVFYGMAQPAINNAAHMGGLATGFLLAAAVRPDLSARRRWGARQLAGVLAVLASLGGAWLAAGRRVEASPDARLESLRYSAPRVEVQPGKEVLYVRGATADEARALGRGLAEKGLFNGAGEVTILMARGEEGLEISFLVRPEALAEPGALKGWEVTATDISADVFDRQPVAVHLCDSYFDPLKTVLSGSKLEIGPNQKLYFERGVTEAEAGAVARALRKRNYGEGAEGAYVGLSKSPEGYEVLFLLKEGVWDDPENVGWFERLASELSAEALDGSPVTIHLCDKDFAPKKTVRSRGRAAAGGGPRTDGP